LVNLKKVINRNGSQIVDLDKKDLALRKDQSNIGAFKFAKAVKMTDIVTHVNESDFRPYICEYSILKNIAFVPSTADVNLDL
jgi:hypothetical protein